ncbi:cyclic nucleotide-binding domain containing protein, putative [Babesia ovis]|uniref:Cyclic nucleotide-binding domain containing protein, putative n=1 Tax=Babesia ovis TaxID=5869 RepID=A0A9W5TCI7_BABOV|nr:cyclic nucleotide-binding domain containing protein, putative [Babesia ovis]
MPPGSKCTCVAKLAQLHETVLYELHPCKDQVYETRISQLQGTIDKLQLKYDSSMVTYRNEDLRSELADIHSKIASDPFLSSKFHSVSSNSQGGSSRVHGLDLHPASTSTDLYRQLTLLEDRNRELEGRLSSEQAVSMSWKHRIQDLEQRLRSQLDDLVDTTRDVACLNDADCARLRSDKRDALSKEAFDLLKLARIRIDDDKNRIECCIARIAELEKELMEQRYRDSDTANQLVSNSVYGGLPSDSKEPQ